jgi:hypothetical protein
LSSIEQISPAGKKMAARTAPHSAFEIDAGDIKKASAHDMGMGGGVSTKINRPCKSPT